MKLTWHDGSNTPKQVADHPVPGMGVMFIARQGPVVCRLQPLQALPGEGIHGLQGTAADHSAVHRPLEGMDQGMQGRQPDHVQFRLRLRVTETVLLGNVAYRAGRLLQWDAEAMKAVNCPDADRLLRRQYREGWRL